MFATTIEIIVEVVEISCLFLLFLLIITNQFKVCRHRVSCGVYIHLLQSSIFYKKILNNILISKKAREYGHSYIYKHLFLTLTLSADFSVVELWRETGFRFIFIFS